MILSLICVFSAGMGPQLYAAASPAFQLAHPSSNALNLPDSLGLTSTGEGRSCVLHRVEQGETLYGLSRRYGTTVAEIQGFNPALAENGLRFADTLCIPKTPVAPAHIAAMAPSPDAFWHVLEAEETLFALSRRYQVPLQSLLEANPNLDPRSLKPGTQLRIPDRASVKSTQPDHALAEPKVLPLTPLNTFPSAQSSAQPVVLPASIPGAQSHSLSPIPTSTSDVQAAAEPSLFAGTATLVALVGEKPLLFAAEGARKEEFYSTAPPSMPEPSPGYAAAIAASAVKERGIATWIESSEPQKDSGVMLALHNQAPIGSWIEVRNLMNNKAVRAKVVGRLPQNLQDSQAVVKLSHTAAQQLQAHDPKVLVEVLYIPTIEDPE